MVTRKFFDQFKGSGDFLYRVRDPPPLRGSTRLTSSFFSQILGSLLHFFFLLLVLDSTKQHYASLVHFFYAVQLELFFSSFLASSSSQQLGACNYHIKITWHLLSRANQPEQSTFSLQIPKKKNLQRATLDGASQPRNTHSSRANPVEPVEITTTTTTGKLVCAAELPLSLVVATEHCAALTLARGAAVRAMEMAGDGSSFSIFSRPSR